MGVCFVTLIPYVPLQFYVRGRGTMVGVNTPNHWGKYPNSDKKTIRLDVKVVCPVCGNVGLLVLRRRGNNIYAYVYHGYEGRRKIEHYVGKAPEPGTPEFEQFIRELEEKRVIRLILGISEFQKLADIASKRGTTIENIILNIIRDYINKLREEALTEALRSNIPPPSPTGSNRRTGSTGVKKQWEWWKQGARRS